MKKLSLALLSMFVCNVANAADVVYADFEGETYGEWVAEGTAFGKGPARGTLPDQMTVSGFMGKGLVNSYLGGDKPTGTLTSPEFTITHNYLSFLIGGGKQPDDLGIELLIDGKRQRVATGRDSEELVWHSWNVGEFRGKTARLRIFDRASGGWGHILVDQITFTDKPRQTRVVGRLEEYRKSPDYYREPFRPQFHFTPEINWMNDPNGLVYFDGEYHLFYQYNPLGNEWGHMSWGHAVSKNLVNWEHLPIALYEEYGVMAFSGSAVADLENTSQFGTREKPPLVAIYTGHGHGKQSQDIAFSTDRGRSWTKYRDNPVLDIDEAEFRDPKVSWHAGTKQWVMVVSLAAKKRLQFYGSKDLKKWVFLSEFGPAGVANKPNWECPDLFELPIRNEPGKTRWILKADMGSGSIAGGSGGEYFTGVFDGKTFIADSKESQWIDYGRDFYASVSWSNIPEKDGRRILLGWMNNWETALNPTKPWRSAMSIPRELILERSGDTLGLCQTPVRELSLLHGKVEEVKDILLNNAVRRLETRGQQLDVLLEMEPGTATDVGIRLLKSDTEQTVVGYDAKAKKIYVDRTKSGNVGYHKAFAGRHAGPLAPDSNGRIRLRILVDSCSVEVFGNRGETVITDLVFPSADSDRLELFASGGQATITSCRIDAMKSIWPATENKEKSK